MHPGTATLIHFSPTGTTRKILEAIAEGMGTPATKRIDITLPSSESVTPALPAGCAIIGVPVYGGRVPLLAAKRLSRINGNGIPAVLVAVYGNRAYDDALLELLHLAGERGFVPVASGAFIGEHSFSAGDTPIAPGRPDGDDLVKARAFGERVIKKLKSGPGIPPLAAHVIPGSVPHKEHLPNAGITPRVDTALCTLCGICETVCPSGTISFSGEVSFTPGNCILCHACVKSCPERALAFEAPGIRQTAEKISALCAKRREPEYFL
jgi:ferredoxin